MSVYLQFDWKEYESVKLNLEGISSYSYYPSGYIHNICTSVNNICQNHMVTKIKPSKKKEF